MKKLSAVLLSMAMVVSLTGCSMDFSSMFAKKPQNAEQLLEKVVTTDNANVDMNMELSMEMSAEGLSMTIPIKMNMNMDVAGDNGHGNMSMSMSFMGQKEDVDMEMYYADGYFYYYDEDTDTWYKSDAESMPMNLAQTNGKLDPKYFENAEFNYDKESDTYTLKQTMEEFMKSDEGNAAMLNSMGDSLDDEMTQSMIEQLGKGSVVYTFDNKYHLIGLHTEDCSFSTDEENYSMSVSYDIEMTLSNINQISEDDVKLPKKVKEDAQEKDGDMFNLGNTDGGTTSGDDDFGWSTGGNTENNDPDDGFGWSETPEKPDNNGDDNTDDFGWDTEKPDNDNTDDVITGTSSNGSTVERYLYLENGSLLLSVPKEWNVSDQMDSIVCAYPGNYSVTWSDSYIEVRDTFRIEKEAGYQKEYGDVSEIYTFTMNGKDCYAFYVNKNSDLGNSFDVQIYQDLGLENYVSSRVHYYDGQITSDKDFESVINTFALGSTVEYKMSK